MYRMAWKQAGCSRWRAVGTGKRKCEPMCVLAVLSGGELERSRTAG